MHRIDRGNCGCLVLAKNDETHVKLVAEFFMRGTNKSYLALVHGKANTQQDSSIAISEDGKCIIHIPVNGRPARSRFEILDIYGDEKASLLRIRTDTGRKHQVRVLCASRFGMSRWSRCTVSSKWQCCCKTDEC